MAQIRILSIFHHKKKNTAEKLTPFRRHPPIFFNPQEL